jgi:hypothetical protein
MKHKKFMNPYEYKLKGLKDKFKEEKLLKAEGIPQNKVVKIYEFEISKLLKHQ